MEKYGVSRVYVLSSSCASGCSVYTKNVSVSKGDAELQIASFFLHAVASKRPKHANIAESNAGRF